jgi:deoxyribose-phosphate aldolase
VCVDCEVDFVKTSTGFASVGAEPRTVKLMRANLPSKIKIKAAGGIKTNKQALELLLAGADVLGCSNSLKIIEENNENN